MQDLLNYSSLIAFVVFSIGIVLQMKKTYLSKNVEGIAVPEVALRFIGSSIIFIKVVTTKDLFLIAGMSLFVTALFAYLLLVLRNRKKE